MKPDKDIIAIAEANKINFTIAKHLGTIATTTSEIWCGTETKQEVPNYHGDHNVMAKAISTLNTLQLISYMENLYEIVKADITGSAVHYDRGYEDCKRAVLFEAGKTHLASPAQEAEAYLKAIGKWEEEE